MAPPGLVHLAASGGGAKGQGAGLRARLKARVAGAPNPETCPQPLPAPTWLPEPGQEGSNPPDYNGIKLETFDEKITAAGGMELFVGSIGPDEHITFNELGSNMVYRTHVKTLAMDTSLANARFFNGDLTKVPTMALMVGVGTIKDAREVMVLITGGYKAIEEGVGHLWTVSVFRQCPHTVFACDEDATLELTVKTTRYFRGLMLVQNKLADPCTVSKRRKQKSQSSKTPYRD
ncbi:glucosamine-6-phosphate isomerase 1-like [Choloepus didactylus]|uniref:glucosamine-6-phosphate isomerase 1-like n=1 Tax=Choloepus didactylus TaxID=27675 RepID=UPI00189FA27E|nr:glucosamine-6-phosphate isomerase 1-like [Choloepus didactylus]